MLFDFLWVILKINLVHKNVLSNKKYQENEYQIDAQILMCRPYKVRRVKQSNSCTDNTVEIIDKCIARKHYKIAGEYKV